MSESTNLFVVMWCNEGLECVIPATNPDHEEIMAILKGVNPDTSVARTVGMMMMRARFNSHRCYEIYGVAAVDSITKEDIEEMFENAPQEAAETIRRLGNQIYSDRATPSRIKIT